jgi:heme oxygenase
MHKILPTLKTDTLHCHQALENSYPFNQLTSSNLDAVTYGKALQILYSAHNWLEPQIEQCLPTDFLAEIGYTPHISSLANDLQALALSSADFVQDDKLNLSETLGALYVLTGSCLGAKLLQRHLLSFPHLPIEFYSKAAKSSEAWPKFRQGFEQYCETHISDKSDITLGAERVFNYLLTCTEQISMLPEKITA